MTFRLDQRLLLPELADLLGLQSSEFTVDRILRGGMGECVRVVQGATSFALKSIQREIIDDRDAWDRYLREVRIWTTLSACDGIVEALCITRIDELPVVCSRWMPGGNLRIHLIDRSPELFFSVMSRVVGTLAWAYQHHHVIHRDVKPENILLDEANLAFVADWGLARPLAVASASNQRESSGPHRGDGDPRVTVPGQALGTLAYASPEQLRGAGTVDHRSDVYSLGCLMYEWESGSCPFIGTATEVWTKHLREAPAPLGGIFKSTTFGVESLIRECLRKDPSTRPDYTEIDLALAKAAKKRNIEYRRFTPTPRYDTPHFGESAFNNFVHTAKHNANSSTSHVVADYSELQPSLREAEHLMGLGDYAKAERILSALFVPEASKSLPDATWVQSVTISYAVCLIHLGRATEASGVLNSISAATRKPATYFVNRSLALIRTADHHAAKAIAQEGLRHFPRDPDLVGNLLVAQTEMGSFGEAFNTAKTRLVEPRGVHALQEVGTLYLKHAASVRETDWPLAVEQLSHAASLLREAKTVNPRFLPARFQLATVLEAVTAYGQCADELRELDELPMHPSDRVFVAYLAACCKDRVGDHRGCLQLCNEWLKAVAELGDTLKDRHNVVMLERVRAATIVDGFVIGKATPGGERVIVRDVVEFFARIVDDERLRDPDDFCYLARIREWMGECEEAETVLLKARPIYPQHWGIPFHRASFRWRARDFGGAISHAECASELAPWRIQTWKLLAQIQHALGRSAQANAAEVRAAEIEQTRRRLSATVQAL